MIGNQRVKMVGGTGIEPVTPTMSRQCPLRKPAVTLGSSQDMTRKGPRTPSEQRRSLRQVSAKSGDEGYVYFMYARDPSAPEEAEGYFKIGYALDVERRKYNLQTALPFDLEVEEVFRGTEADEGALHAHLAAHRIKREWFHANEAVHEYLDDLRDAAICYAMVNGDDYEPTIKELMAGAPYARSDLHAWFASAGNAADRLPVPGAPFPHTRNGST